MSPAFFYNFLLVPSDSFSLSTAVFRYENGNALVTDLVVYSGAENALCIYGSKKSMPPDNAISVFPCVDRLKTALDVS